MTATNGGNAGLMPAAAAHPVAAGFRSVRVAAVDREGDDVISLTLQDPERHPLQTALPGQYVVLRLRAGARVSPFFRSYSLSGPPSAERYRISVKLEPNGAAGACLRTFRVGDLLDISLPRGSFTLREEARPVVLLSAGIGATPVLAMLYELAASQSRRPVLWLYQTRDRTAPSIRCGGSPLARPTPEWTAAMSATAGRARMIGSARISTTRVTSPDRSSRPYRRLIRGRRLSMRSESLSWRT